MIFSLSRVLCGSRLGVLTVHPCLSRLQPGGRQGRGFRSRLWTGSTASLGDVDGRDWGYEGEQLRRSASPGTGDLRDRKWRGVSDLGDTQARVRRGTRRELGWVPRKG